VLKQGSKGGSQAFPLPACFTSQYSILSARASQLASMMLVEPVWNTDNVLGITEVAHQANLGKSLPFICY